MKKNIYGIIDMKTGNFGDLCILDRDEEFRDGFLKFFRDTDIPDYIIRDLLAVRYGTIYYDSDSIYPKIDLESFPKTVISGSDLLSIKLTEVVSRETSVANEDLHLCESRDFSDLDSGPEDYSDDKDGDI